MENYSGGCAYGYNDNLEWLDFPMSPSSSIIDRQTRTCVLLDKRAREFYDKFEAAESITTQLTTFIHMARARGIGYPSQAVP